MLPGASLPYDSHGAIRKPGLTCQGGCGPVLWELTPSPTAVVIGMGTCLAFSVGVGGPKLRSSCFHIKGLTHGAFFSALNIIFNFRFFSLLILIFFY